jgi:hypothetical protein
MFVVAVLAAFASVSTEARAMLVYSYYSDQIIITTDERWSGPVDLPPEVGPSIAGIVNLSERRAEENRFV